jgi:hypothetical protein
MFFIKNALTYLSNIVGGLIVDSDKCTSLLQHVEITVIKNVYRTGPLDVFHQKCSFSSVLHSKWMTD